MRSSTILEIPLNDKIIELLHRYKYHDVYRKLEFLAKTEVLSSLSFETLTIMAKNVHLVKCKYGEVIMRSGEVSNCLNIIRKGTATVKYVIYGLLSRSSFRKRPARRNRNGTRRYP